MECHRSAAPGRRRSTECPNRPPVRERSNAFPFFSRGSWLSPALLQIVQEYAPKKIHKCDWWLVTLVAIPVPAALLLPTVIVKPMVVPVGTGVASALLVTLRMGDWANAAREDNARTETATRACMTEYLPYDRTAGNREQSIKRIIPINYIERSCSPGRSRRHGRRSLRQPAAFRAARQRTKRHSNDLVPVLVTE